MVMADSEILAKYNKAENKKSCIRILADLNGTGIKEMASHLEKLGAILPPTTTKKAAAEVVLGTNLKAFAESIAALAQEFPNAVVCIGGGALTAMVVITRYDVAGKPISTEVKLEAGRGKNA